jgi:hypothetical protein
MELKSLSQRIKCVKLESRSLRMFLECLGDSSMRLGVPFIAPRQLGAVGDQQGRPKLPSVRWRTGLVPISFLFWRRRPLQIRGSWRTGHCPVHTGQSGAPCRPLERALRRPRIARPTVALPAVGSPDSPVHHWTVQWTIAVRRRFFPRVAYAPEAGLAHRTLSGAPPDSSVCQAELDFGCTKPSLLHFFSFLLFSVSSTLDNIC